MKLSHALNLVGGERAIDSLCAPATVLSPLPIADLVQSVHQIRAEQPRVVARLMDSPVSPSVGHALDEPRLSRVVLRDAGQVARRFIQSIGQAGGELLDLPNRALLPRDDSLLVDAIGLLFRSAESASRKEREVFAGDFRRVIAEADASQGLPLGIVLNPMFLGDVRNDSSLDEVADALIHAREDIDESRGDVQRKALLSRTPEFDRWVQSLIRAGSKKLVNLGAPVLLR